MRARALVLAVSLAAGVAARAADQPEVELRQAETALKAAVNAPDQGIPKELLERAECIGVFPGVKKAAWIVGGEFGRGVFTCRKQNGDMGAPGLFNMGGPSIGWQFGGEEADVILLVMNEGGLKHLLSDRFTVGAEASAAAGPVGRTVQAATDAQLHAQILSWSRSRGVFLGASLEGIVVTPNEKANDELYGKHVSAREILVEQDTHVPSVALAFVKTSTTFAKRSS